MWSVNFFDLILVMTNGGPLFSECTSSLFICRQAFEFGLLSKGAAVGFVDSNEFGISIFVYQTIKESR